MHEDGVEFQVLLRPLSMARNYDIADAPLRDAEELRYAEEEGRRLAAFLTTKLKQQSVLLLVTPVMASFVEV